MDKNQDIIQGFKATMMQGNMTTPQAELSAEVLRHLEQQYSGTAPTKASVMDDGSNAGAAASKSP